MAVVVTGRWLQRWGGGGGGSGGGGGGGGGGAGAGAGAALFDRISRANVSGGSAMSAGQLAVMDLAPACPPVRPAGRRPLHTARLAVDLPPAGRRAADGIAAAAPRNSPRDECLPARVAARPLRQPERRLAGSSRGEVWMTRGSETLGGAPADTQSWYCLSTCHSEDAERFSGHQRLKRGRRRLTSASAGAGPCHSQRMFCRRS